jgi:hypothetical protein
MRTQRTSLKSTSNKKPKKNSPKFGRVIVSLLLIGGIGFIAFELTDIYRRRYAIEQEKQQFAQEIKEIQFQNTELSRLQSYISSELYQDRELKRRLDYQNPEETAVVVDVPEEELPSDTSEFPPSESDSLSPRLPQAETLPEKWWAFFFSKNRL